MGKKAKVGKQRKDKFYKLAKETGFRSRASFKLIQLNRKFEFLQKSRVLIDLCAAPGGWLQVAQKSMPVSSLIIGVDLDSIKPIPSVITLQEDITTDKCRQMLKKHLKTWKADTILHDGAPNVGKNWIHDAFAQNQLTLSALKLATEMLIPGGWFITKVFRSKDYNSLLWVFGKLFKKVHVTKPQASRNESAEIFVVCQHYTAPTRIDPQFLDPGHLFKDIETTDQKKNNLLQATNRKIKAEGYDEGDKSVFHRLKASDFIFGDNHMDALAQSTEIIFDLDDIQNHRTTTSDIKEYCKDLKVLGKAELRLLLNWRKNMLAAIKEQEPKNDNLSNVIDEDAEHSESDVDEAVKEAESLELEKYQDLKRKKKKFLKERRKTQEKIDLKMIIKDDEPIIEEDRELFNIRLIKSKKGLSQLEEGEGLEIEEEIEESEDEKSCTDSYRKTLVSYNKHHDRDAAWPEDEDTKKDDSDSDSDNDDKDQDIFQDQNNSEADDNDENLDISMEEYEDNEEKQNPLLIPLAEKSQRSKEAVARWFDKDLFGNLSEDDDVDLELITETTKKKKKSDETANVQKPVTNQVKGILKKPLDINKDENVNVQEADVTKPKKKKRVRLDPEGLALGSLMIYSKKAKRDILDNAYNRFSSNDEGLPDWFVEDEKKHYRKQMPVTAEMVAEYKAQLREINARPLKKVVQAKTRKKRRAMRKMEKARKRAEAVTENVDMSEKEKMEQLKGIYKKALQKKDQNVTYVVAKKGMGRRAQRPTGVKGRYKIVDRRMKKDDRRRKTNLKTQKKMRRPGKRQRQK